MLICRERQYNLLQGIFYVFEYFQSKDNSVKCIADTYKNSEHMKMAILNAVKANLNAVVAKKLVDNRYYYREQIKSVQLNTYLFF